MTPAPKDPLGRTITASEIARLAGVRPSAVSNWRKRFADFPQPVGEAATGGDVFDSRDVERWLRERNRSPRPARGAAEQLWSLTDRLRGSVRAGDPGEVIAVGALLIDRTRRATGRPAKELDGTPDQVARWVEETTQGLAKTQNMERLFQPLHSMDAADLKTLLEALGDIDADALSVAVDGAIDRSQRYGEFQFRTPPPTTDLLVSIARPSGKVFDPATGSGEFLIRAAMSTQPTDLYGQELSENAWRIAMARSLLRGLEPHIALGDSLFEDYWPDLRADLVLCDPPAGVRFPPHAGGLGDPRWRLLGSLETPPSRAADFAWLAHAIHHLSAEGRGYLLLPPGTLFRGGAEAKFRSELLRQGTIEAVVTLPAPPGGTGAASLWIVRPPAATAQDVLLIHAQDSEKTLTPKIATGIREAVQAWRADPSTFHPVPGFATTVPVLELLSGDVSLLPGRWVSEPELLDPDTVLANVQRATATLAQAHKSLPSDSPIPTVRPADGDVERFRVGELIEHGLATLVRPARMNRDDYVESGLPVWEPADVRVPWEREDEARCADPNTVDPRNVTEPGDIVITTIGELRTRVDTEGGHVLGTSLHALRLDPAAFDPHSVAALLMSTQNRGTMSGTTIPRVNIRELEFPRLDSSDAARLRQTLAALDADEAAARSLAGGAAQTRAAIIDAVAAGVAIIGEPPQTRQRAPKRKKGPNQ